MCLLKIKVIDEKTNGSGSFRQWPYTEDVGKIYT